MTLGKICELIIEGRSNAEIARVIVDAGLEKSISTTEKGLGFLKRLLSNGNSAEALMLVKQIKTGEGKVLTETFARRSLQDETIPDHLVVDRLTTAPGGGQWRKYKVDAGAQAEEEKARIAALITEIKTGFKKAKTKKVKGSGVGVIGMADFHYGMKYDGDLKNPPFSIETLAQSVRDAADKINAMGLKEVHLLLPGDFIESFTGLNHMDAWKNLESYGRDAVIGVAELLRDELILRINNVAHVYMIAGNHDRVSLKKDIDSRGEAAKLVADFLGLMVDVPISFDYTILNPTIDGIRYIITHGHLGLSKMEPNAMILEYGDQKLYNVMVNAHGHHLLLKKGMKARKDFETNVITLEGSNYIRIQLAPMVTGGAFSASIGGNSSSGFSTFMNNGKGKLDYSCLAA